MKLLSKVFVYRNLHHRGVVYSLRSCVTRRVIGYSSSIFLKDASFKVSETGRKRVLKEKRKNVHAGVKGTLVDDFKASGSGIKVSYNPYKAPYFFEVKTGAEIRGAKWVKITEDGVFAWK